MNKNATARAAKRTEKSPRLEVFVKKNRTQYPKDTWVVFTTEGEKRKRPRVFEGRLTRDNVRTAYASANKVSFQETRSRRVENY